MRCSTNVFSVPVMVFTLVVMTEGLPGCQEHGTGTDAGLSDAGDANIEQDVTVVPDARMDAMVDAALHDATVDAAPNPNVIVLPPSGQTDVFSFTNAGFIATYADDRGAPSMGADVYYYDVLARQEVQVTDRENAQTNPDTDGQVIIFDDSQFTDVANGHYETELFSYDISTGNETRLTDVLGQQFQPRFSQMHILYKSDAGCGLHTIFNLTLWDLTTGEATVVANCDQNAETHSIGEFYAAWSARPYPAHNKDIYVRDLAAGYTFHLDSTDAGSQYFPTTDDDHVVWQDDRDGRREIYVYTISTGVEECLTPDPWEQGWPFLRDGIVAWCDYSFSQQWGYNAPCDIYVYELATGEGRRVTNESRMWTPRYVDSGWMGYALRISGWHSKLYMHDLVSDGILTPDGHVIP